MTVSKIILLLQVILGIINSYVLFKIFNNNNNLIIKQLIGILYTISLI